MAKNAKAKNLDGAALDYMDLTMTCVKCHKYVRETRMTRLDGERGVDLADFHPGSNGKQRNEPSPWPAGQNRTPPCDAWTLNGRSPLRRSGRYGSRPQETGLKPPGADKWAAWHARCFAPPRSARPLTEAIRRRFTLLGESFSIGHKEGVPMSGEMSEVFIETPTPGVDPQGRTVGGARETKGTSRHPVVYLNDIRARAYKNWKAAGMPSGDCTRFWLRRSKRSRMRSNHVSAEIGG